MRVFTLTAVVTLLASAPAAAQVSPDSVRPQDTEPNIPVQTPTLGEPGSGAASTGSRGTGQSADAPVSSTDPAVGGTAGDDAGLAQGADGMSGQAATGAGLPERAAAPRTLRAYWHVYIAFTVAWVLLFGYAISIGLRMSRLEREMTRQRGAG